MRVDSGVVGPGVLCLAVGVIFHTIHRVSARSPPLSAPLSVFDSSPVGCGEQTGNVLDAFLLASSANTALPAGRRQGGKGRAVTLLEMV